MAEQPRPLSPQNAPDPANSYERTDPQRESGQGRLENNTATPAAREDDMQQSVKNKKAPQQQINAQDTTNQKAAKQPDYSMFEEEPLGADQVPTDIKDPRNKRHPRTGGKGGTPDVGEATSKG